MAKTPDTVEWVFDPSPPSGGRTGGNVAEYAFDPDVETFVREVIQNVLDNARSSDSGAQVEFKLIRLKESDLDEFLHGIRWSQIRTHIEAAGLEKAGRRFRQALERFASEKSLLLLVVEDRNTTGLIGAEKGDKSNFAALCRNTLYSNKPSETAGGSYGLGKAVLWLFSDFSTVIFNSMLETDGDAGNSPRFIGRIELPWHKVDMAEFGGSGWLGKRASGQAGDWAESVWSPASVPISRGLHLGRDAAAGTSILVVGFRNPAAEDQGPQPMAAEMVRAAAKNFWPSVVGGRLEVGVEVIDTGRKQPKLFEQKVAEGDINPAYVECLSAYREQKTVHELMTPGDVAEIPIELTIPARTDNSTSSVHAEASLVVRLAEDEGDDDVNQVAFFRGTGMVVKYEAYSRLSLTQRPFHGILVCGRARRSPGENDVALDEFLRAAEPPAHKSWEVTSRLKELYKPGYRKLLTNMDKQVSDALRELVSEKTPGGSEGPRMLMKLFPLGVNKSSSEKSLFKVRDQKAEFINGAWVFSGQIAVRGENKRPWTARVDLRFRAEDPTDSVSAIVKTLEIDKIAVGRGAKVSIEKEVATIAAPANVKQVVFQGSTDPSRYSVDVRRTTVSVEVRCKTE